MLLTGYFSIKFLANPSWANVGKPELSQHRVTFRDAGPTLNWHLLVFVGVLLLEFARSNTDCHMVWNGFDLNWLIWVPGNMSKMSTVPCSAVAIKYSYMLIWETFYTFALSVGHGYTQVQ